MNRRVVELAADQAVSSLTTFALSIYAAREATVDDFGVFAVAYALFWALMGTTRAFVGEVSLIIGTEKLDATGQWRSFSATTSLVAGTFSAAVLFLGCLLIGSPDALAIGWTFAVAAPIAFLGDGLRYVAFTDDAPGDALKLDAVWLVGALLGPPLIGLTGLPSIPAAILGWGLGAALGTGLMFKLRPCWRMRLKGCLRWVADRRLVGIQYAADFLANNGIGQAVTALVPLVSSLAVAGALRAGGIIQGPLNVVYSAMMVFLIPRARRSLSPHRLLPSPAPFVIVCLTGFCGLYAAAVLLMPDSWGEFLLGPSWHMGRLVSPLLIAAYVLGGIAQILVQIMRLRDSAGLVVQVRVFVAVLTSVGVLTGAAFFGAVGAASAFALSALIAIVPWWVALVHSRRKFGGDSS
ncbi:hypothetical protein [Mycobacterium sp. SMC-4]|uniref:hypothetical protein n=1 Tax=Mycobacterium sp. SMC-4 TaxID=2857059 RepID=UPI0021B4171C|nr:hypothetical protein [Mycobacterium sp. SMC-4]UXA19284.1 hypothetical protein KXD98_06580 [Mycobacterium sp. SMC-4]